jgi:hypothetical protein
VAENFQDIMVLITNPPDFGSWPSDMKIERYRRVLEWHDYISRLNPVRVPQVWGTHQILSQIRPSPVQEMLIAVYRVSTLFEFDDLLYRDPLRDLSYYTTFLLAPLANDLADDTARFEQLKAALTVGKDPEHLAQMSAHRALFKNAPEYVGKYPLVAPPNPIVHYMSDPLAPPEERPLRILVYGQNPPEYMTWDDHRKLIHYEKVLWWHHHIAEMANTDRLSHVWGMHDFCDIAMLSGRSASGTAIYKAKDLDDFDDMYRSDPLRDMGRFWSVVLKPADQQRTLDEERLRRATERAVASK